MICCCKLASSPETRNTSLCILMAVTGPFPESLLRRRFLLGVPPELFPVSWLSAPEASLFYTEEADTKRCRLLATSRLLLDAAVPLAVPLLPPPSLASSPSDDQSSLLEILKSSTNLYKRKR